MPVTIDIEKDYLYNLGLKKAEKLIKQAKEAAFKANKEKEKMALEKAEAKAEAEAEKAELEAKAEAEKAKAEAEKAKAEAKQKISIQKLQAGNKNTDEEIMDILSLDEKTFQQYVKEIREDLKK